MEEALFGGSSIRAVLQNGKSEIFRDAASRGCPKWDDFSKTSVSDRMPGSTSAQVLVCVAVRCVACELSPETEHPTTTRLPDRRNPKGLINEQREEREQTEQIRMYNEYLGMDGSSLNHSRSMHHT